MNFMKFKTFSNKDKHNGNDKETVRIVWFYLNFKWVINSVAYRKEEVAINKEKGYHYSLQVY